LQAALIDWIGGDGMPPRLAFCCWIQVCDGSHAQTLQAITPVWLAAGTSESLQQVLGDAVAACPQSIVLWLMCAKEQWLAGDVQNARAVLERAHSKNPDSEEVILAAFKLEFENNEPERARLLAQRAKESLSDPSARVWQKAAMVARELNHVQVCSAPLSTLRLCLGQVFL
jgi:pre-mRNA-processing factor 6